MEVVDKPEPTADPEFTDNIEVSVPPVVPQPETWSDSDAEVSPAALKNNRMFF